jgi:hypothetical protein
MGGRGEIPRRRRRSVAVLPAGDAPWIPCDNRMTMNSNWRFGLIEPERSNQSLVAFTRYKGPRFIALISKQLTHTRERNEQLNR